jgi:PAS domain S-box-containing protein
MQSEALYRNMFEKAPAGVLRVDAQGVITEANSRATEILSEKGLSLEGVNLKSLDRAGPLLEVLKNSKNKLPAQIKFKSSQGPDKYFKVYLSRLDIPGTNLWSWLIMLEDISDMVLAQEILQKNEQRWHSLAEDLYLAVVEIDVHGKIIYANQRYQQIFDDQPGDSLLEQAYSLEEVLRLEKTLKEVVKNKVSFGVYTGKFKNASSEKGARFCKGHWKLKTNAQGQAEGFVVVVEDLTQEIEIQEQHHLIHEQLKNSAKLEALGRLAGGVAHDFNNLLTGILGYVDMIKLEKPGEDISEYNSIIEKTALRAQALTGQLLGFARKGQLRKINVNLVNLVTEVLTLLKHSVSKKIRFNLVISDPVLEIEGDPDQLHQVIMNLLINACDALPNGGKICVELKYQPPDFLAEVPTVAGELPFVWNRESVRLKIQDNGDGILPHLRDKIFEPFFTTKPKDKGTGMGLPMAYGIVRNHNGRIWHEPASPKGSIFQVLFPACVKLKPAIKENFQSTNFEIRPGQGKILVVDDEAVIRNVCVGFLKTEGYTVMIAENGKQALEIYKEFVPDLVLLDWMMPVMDGSQCFFGLKKINPRVKVLVMTGYAAQEEIQTLLKKGALGLLQKPFQRLKLVFEVQQALES